MDFIANISIDYKRLPAFIRKRCFNVKKNTRDVQDQRATMQYIKRYYESSLGYWECKLEEFKKVIESVEQSIIPRLESDYEELTHERLKRQPVGQCRKYTEVADSFYPSLYTIHKGVVKLVSEFSGSDAEFNKYVDRLADIGMCFETEEQAEEYLEKLKAETRG